MHTVEAFLLIKHPRQRLSYWTRALAALDAATAPHTSAIVAYYDPTRDQALINLQYAAVDANMKYIVSVAHLIEAVLVQPHELSEGERARFLAERLTCCTIRVTTQPTVISALTELVNILESTPPVRQVPDAPRRSRSGNVQPRGNTNDSPFATPAEGTRGNAQVYDATPPPAARHTRRRVRQDATVPMPMDLADKLTAASSQSDLDAFQRPTVVRDSDPDRAPHPHGTASRPTVPRTAKLPNMIYAKYLRGGRWIAVRVGALSLRTATLLSGASPRIKDRVELALWFGPHRAVVRGTVARVASTRETCSTGAAGFTVDFDLDTNARRQLTALLLAARDAKITIKPPPARSTRRFPVEWHIAISTGESVVKAVALDVSVFGMFIKPAQPLAVGTELTVSVMLDDGSAPIDGRAKVVREITAADARPCGLIPGYGLVLTNMSEPDRMRWLAFLARIERRADKRVLIGATPSRFAELEAVLASLGYTVTGGTDPGALAQIVNTDSRPADAVLIDAGWLPHDSASMVQNLFTARNVPCVTMQGEVRRARQAIDRLLEVVV